MRQKNNKDKPEILLKVGFTESIGKPLSELEPKAHPRWAKKRKRTKRHGRSSRR